MSDFDIKSVIPKGWELVGFRCPRANEHYLGSRGEGGVTVDQAEFDWHISNMLIVEREKVWRNATVEDAVRGVREGGLPCRVRDNHTNPWIYRRLVGYNANATYPWLTHDTGEWKHCQVLDTE